MGKVIAVTSGKGGTGKTVFTANLGAVLAERGYKVVLIDMDMGLRNLDLCMGIENKVVYDVADVLLGVCRIKQALIRDKRFESLYVMASPQYKKEEDITPLHMKVLCGKLKDKFDYIILDSPAGLDEGFRLAAYPADEAIILTTPEYSAIRDADVVDKCLAQMGIEERTYVLNKVNADLINSGLVPSLPEITSMMRLELAGIIQDDENIHIAANKGIPIVLKKNTYIRKNFEQIADRVI